MIYIHAFGIHNVQPEKNPPDLKVVLRTLSGKVYRRIDRFIQLAIIGAHKAVASYELDPETALYLTSGQGDIPVFARVRQQRYFQKMMSKPVDFVNLASNTAGFYVASHLGLNGTNLFLSHHDFPVQMALLLAQSDLDLHKQSAILLGGVDGWFADQELARKILGVNETTQLGEGSNWMLLKRDLEGAVASLTVEPELLDFSALKERIARAEPDVRLAFSSSLPVTVIDEIMGLRADCRRFNYEDLCAYYETLPIFALNLFLRRESGELLHIDSDGERYMIMRIAQPD
ncbi:MAG TPA: hypothetical protein EYP64_00185 [Desulfarculaceae bacterium]|nr:hypothetical protein [Desulfarculaceae bacterium]